MHACWNLFLKQSEDRLVTMATIHLVSGAVGMAAIPFLPLPCVESWPYIFASVVLHLGYQLFLVKAYVYGDLGQVYPIARGISPLFTGVYYCVLDWRRAYFASDVSNRFNFSGHIQPHVSWENVDKVYIPSNYLCIGHRMFHCSIYSRRWSGRSRLGKCCFICSMADGIRVFAFAGNNVDSTQTCSF